MRQSRTAQCAASLMRACLGRTAPLEHNAQAAQLPAHPWLTASSAVACSLCEEDGHSVAAGRHMFQSFAVTAVTSHTTAIGTCRGQGWMVSAWAAASYKLRHIHGHNAHTGKLSCAAAMRCTPLTAAVLPCLVGALKAPVCAHPRSLPPPFQRLVVLRSEC